jgi:hypothetical protein
MKNIMLLVLAVMCAGTLSAQEASVVFHPRDPIHILVTFKTPPTPFESAYFSFALLGQPDKGQELLNRGFAGDHVQKLGDTQYEISGTIPDHIVSGHFFLNVISVTIKGVGKQYSSGNDFKELTITIINPERPEFPAIEDIKLAPRN